MWNFKTWYQENKSDLSRRRKRKYKRDPAYRKECKKRALDYYHSHKKRMEPVDRFKIRSADGLLYFTIGRVVRGTKRTAGRIRELHQSGIIPQPLYFDKRGWRLYLRHQLSLLETAFSKVDAGRWGLNDVKKFLEEGWEEETVTK